MSAYHGIVTKKSRPYVESLRDDMKARRDPNFFWPNGTQVYCGTQGSGKTISAVKHILDIKTRYPRCIIVSNLEIFTLQPLIFESEAELKLIMRNRNSVNWAKTYVKFSSMEQLAQALVGINNEKLGVAYLVDEIHTYFNALESKNIPMYVFTEISQQRKQRKLIIGTSQLFMRMAKPLREQCDNLIVCNTVAGVFTIQRVYDGMSVSQDYDGKLVGTIKKKGWFFHTRKLRNSFDTFQKVISGSEQYEQINRIEITGKSNKSLKVG